MKAVLTRTVFDMFTGQTAEKNATFEIIEDKKEYDFVTGDFAMLGKRFTMKVWRCDFKKIDVLS